MKRQTVKFTMITAFLAAMLLTFTGCPVAPKSPGLTEPTFQVRFKNEMATDSFITIGQNSGSNGFTSALDSIPLVKAGTTSSYYTVKTGTYLCYESPDNIDYIGSTGGWDFAADKKYTVRVTDMSFFCTEDGRASRSIAELPAVVKEAQKALTSMRNRAE